MTDFLGALDMHEGTAAYVADVDNLPSGLTATGVVVCVPPFGIGVKLAESGQYGHVDVPHYVEVESHPRVAMTVEVEVLGYPKRAPEWHEGFSQLRLRLRRVLE